MAGELLHIAMALNSFDTEVAKEFVDEVREAAGYSVRYKVIRGYLEELERRDRTVAGVVKQLRSDKPRAVDSDVLTELGSALGVLPAEARLVVERLRARVLLPVTDSDVLAAVYRLGTGSKAEDHILDELELGVVARRLSLPLERVEGFASMISDLVHVPVVPKDIIQALVAVGGDASQGSVLAYFEEKARALTELASVLGIEPQEARRIADRIRAAYPRPVTQSELVAVIKRLGPGDRTEERVVEQLQLNAISRNLGITQQEAMDLGPRLADLTDTPISNEQILEALPQLGYPKTKEAFVASFKEQHTVARLATVFGVPSDEARSIADDLRSRFPLALAYEELLEAVQGPDGKLRTADEIADEMTLNAIARELSMSREDAEGLAPALTYLTQVSINNTQILSALVDLGSEASEAALLAYFADKFAPIVELAETLDVSPTNAREAADRLRAAFPFPITHQELVSAIRRLDPDSRTRAQLLDELASHVLARELSMDRKAIDALVREINEFTEEPTNEHEILLTLARHQVDTSAAALRSYFQEKNAAAEVARILNGVMELEELVELARSELSDSIPVVEVLAAIREIEEAPPSSDNILRHLRVYGLSKAFKMQIRDIQELLARIEREAGHAIDAEELLKEQRRWQATGRTLDPEELPAAWYAANKLGYNLHNAVWAVRGVRQMTEGRASHEDVMNAYKVATTGTIEEVGEIADAFATSRSLDLQMPPAFILNYIHVVHATKDYPVTVEELLEAAQGVEETPPPATKALAMYETQALARAFEINKTRAVRLANEIEQASGFAITPRELLKQQTTVQALGEPLELEQVAVAWYIANNQHVTFRDAARTASRIRERTSGLASYSDILIAYQSVETETHDAVADALLTGVLSRSLSLSAAEIPVFRDTITREIGRQASLEEVAQTVAALEPTATPSEVLAQFRRMAHPILELASALDTSPAEARAIIQNIQHAVGRDCAADDILQITRSMNTNRSLGSLVHELVTRCIAKSLHLDGRALDALRELAVEYIENKSDYALLAEAARVCQGKVSIREAGFVLDIAKTLACSPAKVISLWTEVERSTNRRVQMEDLLKYVRVLPPYARDANGISIHIAMHRLLSDGRDGNQQLFGIHTRLQSDRRLQERFLSLCEIYQRDGTVSIPDLEHLIDVAEWPQAGVDLMLSNRNSGERYITAKFLTGLAHRSPGSQNQIEDLNRMARECWHQIRSDERCYAIPSRGRAEIMTSDLLRRKWGVEALRFVQEGVKPPGAFVQFKFGGPAHVGIMRMTEGREPQGFHTTAASPWIKAVFQAIALTYYRDLVLPGPLYENKGRRRPPSNGPRFPSSPSRDPLPRPRVTGHRKPLRFEDWYEAQTRARHHVTGHRRWVRPGFVADSDKEAQARRAGVNLPLGYTWVVEHERGQDQTTYRVVLDENYDLTEHTVFEPPTRATENLERVLGCIVF